MVQRSRGAAFRERRVNLTEVTQPYELVGNYAWLGLSFLLTNSWKHHDELWGFWAAPFLEWMLTYFCVCTTLILGRPCKGSRQQWKPRGNGSPWIWTLRCSGV